MIKRIILFTLLYAKAYSLLSQTASPLQNLIVPDTAIVSFDKKHKNDSSEFIYDISKKRYYNLNWDIEDNFLNFHDLNSVLWNSEEFKSDIIFHLNILNLLPDSLKIFKENYAKYTNISNDSTSFKFGQYIDSINIASINQISLNEIQSDYVCFFTIKTTNYISNHKIRICLDRNLEIPEIKHQISEKLKLVFTKHYFPIGIYGKITNW